MMNRRALSRLVVTVLASAFLCGLQTTDASAGPDGTQPAVDVAAPAQAAPPPGPLATQITKKEAAVGQLGEQLKQTNQTLIAAGAETQVAYQEWSRANDALTTARDAAAHEASEAYKAATAMGPFDSYAGDLRRLSLLAPGIRTKPGGESAARALQRTEQAERAAWAHHQSVTQVWQQIADQERVLREAYGQRTAELLDLRKRHASELSAVEAEREAFNRSQGEARNLGSATRGQVANRRAQDAVRFALAQIGKPYEWGAEGPHRFDCSGLVWAAYGSVGVSLPRIANTQYAATKPVDVAHLLPGDLIFFGSDPRDWRSIYHMGIYLGGGKMLHAPTPGDVVKISYVWWSGFFGATRVLPAGPAPAPTRSASKPAPATQKPSPSATPSATPSPKPSSSPSTSPSARQSPTTTTSPSRSPSAAPSPSPTPSTSASASP